MGSMKTDKIEKALSCFKKGFNCSQSTFSAYDKELGLCRKTMFKVSGAFGGGMARMGETCGAVSGAFMVIGCKYGQIKPNDKEAKENTYRITTEFMDAFKKRNRSILCKDLLGYDISTPEGSATVKEKNFHETLCPKFIQDAIDILDKILAKN